MDLSMPECDGIEGTRLIKDEFSSTKVVILTTFKNASDIGGFCVWPSTGIFSVNGTDRLWRTEDNRHSSIVRRACKGYTAAAATVAEPVSAKDKLNIKLDLQIFGWGDPYNQKVNTSLASGEPMDIVFTCNWAANFYLNAPAGYFTPLNDYIAKYPAIQDILGKDFLNASQIAGKNYAVPTNKEKVHNWGYCLQKSLVDKLYQSGWAGTMSAQPEY